MPVVVAIASRVVIVMVKVAAVLQHLSFINIAYL